MAGPSLKRWRWRLRGAWMWPSFVALTLADGFIAHWRPVFADSQSVVSGWLYSFIATLIAIVVLAAPLGWLIRRVRGDMPKVVARDYAGTCVCVALALIFAGVGLAHHPVVSADQSALQDATARAEAYVGEHAPAAFRAVQRDRFETVEVQPPEIYRVCASTSSAVSPARWYCVAVDRAKPFAQSVSYSGSEPNAVLSEGTG